MPYREFIIIANNTAYSVYAHSKQDAECRFRNEYRKRCELVFEATDTAYHEWVYQQRKVTGNDVHG